MARLQRRDVDLKELQSRRKRLLKEIARTVGYEVRGRQRGHYLVADLKKVSAWARETYTFPDTVDVNDENNPYMLYEDLKELHGRDWAFLYRLTGGRNQCGEDVESPNPGTWIIALEPEGLAVVEESMKSWWVKAYEKQPMTAIQIILTFITSFITFIGGYVIGKVSNDKDEKTTTQVVAPAPVAPTSMPTSQP